MIINNLQEFYHLLKRNHPIMGVDYGAKKIGIAISNPAQSIAMPLKVIYQVKELDKIKEIINIAKVYSICMIIIGLPVHMNGRLGPEAHKVQEFAKLLERQSDLPIYLQDERLTSKTANHLLKSLNINRKCRNEIDDAVSASLILETVLQIMCVEKQGITNPI